MLSFQQCAGATIEIMSGDCLGCSCHFPFYNIELFTGQQSSFCMPYSYLYVIFIHYCWGLGGAASLYPGELWQIFALTFAG